MKYLALLAAMILTITACSQKNDRSSAVYNEKFNETNFVEVAAKVKADKDFPIKDADLLALGLKRLSFVKDSINGKTVKQIIEAEEIFERDVKMNGLNQISQISLLRLNTKSRYLGVLANKNEKKYLILMRAMKFRNQLFFHFENKINKQIKSIGGEVVLFYNEPGQPSQQLKPFPFNYNAVISPSKTDTIMMMQPYNDTDELSKFIRENTAKMTGLLNITNVEFEEPAGK